MQEALEQRLEQVRLTGKRTTASAPGGPEAADGTKLTVGDQLCDQVGPDVLGWIKTVAEAALTTLGGDKAGWGATPAEHGLGDRARIVLLADWGTGTPRARQIAALAHQRVVQARDVERHLIRLGDAYYCELPDEHSSRFLREWPTGAVATSWNLNGNHDMYSGGHAYFDVVAREPFAQQRGTNCFRMFNDRWQFIGLDTTYSDNDLYDAQIPWLERWVSEPVGNGQAPPPRTVLLSHHQLGSALAQASVGAGIRHKTTRVRHTGRIRAWFGGHEHRAFVYEPCLGVACPGCLGNGGVPELLSKRLTLAGPSRP